MMLSCDEFSYGLINIFTFFLIFQIKQTFNLLQLLPPGRMLISMNQQTPYPFKSILTIPDGLRLENLRPIRPPRVQPALTVSLPKTPILMVLVMVLAWMAPLEILHGTLVEAETL